VLKPLMVVSLHTVNLALQPSEHLKKVMPLPAPLMKFGCLLPGLQAQSKQLESYPGLAYSEIQGLGQPSDELIPYLCNHRKPMEGIMQNQPDNEEIANNSWF